MKEIEQQENDEDVVVRIGPGRKTSAI